MVKLAGWYFDYGNNGYNHTHMGGTPCKLPSIVRSAQGNMLATLWQKGFEIILKNPNVKAIFSKYLLVEIVRCDQNLQTGILEATKMVDVNVPVVVKT